MAQVWIGTSGWVYKDWFDVLHHCECLTLRSKRLTLRLSMSSLTVSQLLGRYLPNTESNSPRNVSPADYRRLV